MLLMFVDLAMPEPAVHTEESVFVVRRVKFQRVEAHVFPAVLVMSLTLLKVYVWNVIRVISLQTASLVSCVLLVLSRQVLEQ